MSSRTLAASYVVAALCGAVALSLGSVVAGEHAPTGLDQAFESGVADVFGGSWVLSVLVAPTEPWAVLPVLGVVAVAGVVRRRPDLTALAVSAPAVAVGLNTVVLKPWFGRYYDDHLAYPSGHTVSLVATVTVVALSVSTTRTRVLTVVVGVVLTGCAAVGMAGLGYHYVTDVVGGAATAVAVTLGMAPPVRAAVTSGFRTGPRRRGPVA